MRGHRAAQMGNTSDCCLHCQAVGFLKPEEEAVISHVQLLVEEGAAASGEELQQPQASDGKRGKYVALLTSDANGRQLDVKPATATDESRKVRILESEPAEEKFVELRRTLTEGSLGLGLFVTPHLLVVQCIPNGMLYSWNQDHPGEEVRKGAAILDVNGVSGNTSEMFALLRSEAVLNVKFRQVSGMKLAIQDATVLGLELDPNTLEVQRVLDDGTIAQHNHSCIPGYHVAPGDVISGVNGEVFDKAEMLRVIREEADMTLTIARWARQETTGKGAANDTETDAADAAPDPGTATTPDPGGSEGG